jgi:hypothetical protein
MYLEKIYGTEKVNITFILLLYYMSCEKLTKKKYITRKGPPYAANSCKDSYQLGNDGLMYYSKSNKNGVYRWVKEPVKPSEPKKSFKVPIKTSQPKIKMYGIQYNSSDNIHYLFIEGNTFRYYTFGYLDFTTRYEVVDFINERGIKSEEAVSTFLKDNYNLKLKPTYSGKFIKEFHGQFTSLLQITKNKWYYFCSDKIQEYKFEDEVLGIDDYLGPNDVPYACFFLENGVIFTSDDQYVDNKNLSKFTDDIAYQLNRQFRKLPADQKVLVKSRFI